MNDRNLHRGHCRCNAISMVSDFTPDFTVYCHCDDCKRATGSPVLASVAFPKESVQWQGLENLSRYKNGTATRLFCNNCGSPIAQEHESRDDLIFFNTGFMDDPEAYPPMLHTFANEQLSWLTLTDNLRRADKSVLINQNTNDGQVK